MGYSNLEEHDNSEWTLNMFKRAFKPSWDVYHVQKGNDNGTENVKTDILV